MNLITLLAILCLTSEYLFPQTCFTCLASDEAEGVAASPTIVAEEDGADDDDDDGDDDYYDLESMTNEELEEMCTSRGFELVREVDAQTGEPIVYTHQDFVDAASECLQIEADLEEILQTHPEILDDVKRENERMLNERNRLIKQLKEQKETEPTVEEDGIETEKVAETNDVPSATKKDSDDTLDQADTSVGTDDTDKQEESEPEITDQETKLTNKTYGTIQQLKADVQKVINLILPKPLQEKIRGYFKQQKVTESNDAPSATKKDSEDTLDQADTSVGTDNTDKLENSEPEIIDQETKLTNRTCGTQTQPNNTLNYNGGYTFKEITLEVIQQMKADLQQVINLILPKPLQEKIQEQFKQQILPALKSFAMVAKDMGLTAYDMARRYIAAFMDQKKGDEGGGEGQPDIANDESMSGEVDTSS